MNKIKYYIGILLLAISLTGCTEAYIKDRSEKPRQVELYSGGIEVRHWISTGNVDLIRGNSPSDVFYFVDKQTDKPVRVSGTVVITIAE